MDKQKIINEFLSKFHNESTECCDVPVLYDVYKDKNGNYGIDEWDFCRDCLEC